MTVLSLDHVSKTYGSGHVAVEALRDVSFSIDAGQVILVMGRSGSGKTTLLTIAGSLLRPTEGRVSVDGVDLAALSARQLAELRLRRIGFVFQSFNLLSALTAEQNVAVPLLAHGVARRTAVERARQVLDSVGLDQRRHHLPRDLSGGEKQRVAIARGLVMGPPLLLVDEPTANLDAHTGEDVAQLLHGLSQEHGSAVLIVSHDDRLRTVADGVLTLEDGQLV